MKNYRDLLVWKKGMELAQHVYLVVRQLPKEELYGLSDQMRRAAVSIPSNIAEGCARDTDREFARFVAIAQGSNAELETQIILCHNLGFIDEATEQQLLSIAEEESKMLRSLATKLKGSVSG